MEGNKITIIEIKDKKSHDERKDIRLSVEGAKGEKRNKQKNADQKGQEGIGGTLGKIKVLGKENQNDPTLQKDIKTEPEGKSTKRRKERNKYTTTASPTVKRKDV